MNQSALLLRRGAPIGLWAALVFVGVVLPAALPDTAVADVYGICYRCFSPVLVEVTPDAFGTNRDLRVLCPRHRNSSESCAEGIAEVEGQIAAQLRTLTALMEGKAQCTGDDLCLEAWERAVDDVKHSLDVLYDVLNRMKAHCQAQDIGGGLDALNSGSGPPPPEGSNVPRDAPTGGADTGRVTGGVEGLNPSTGPRTPEGTNVGRDAPTAAPGATSSRATSGSPAGQVTPRSLGQQLRDRQVRMAPLSTVGAGQSPVPVSTDSLDAVGRRLAALQRAFEPVRGAAFPPDSVEPATSIVDPAAAGVARTWTLSDKGLAEPKLTDVPEAPPRAPSDTGLLAAVPPQNANTVAYADALQHTESEANAALERGDRKKALELVDHALYLATMGQAEGREAEKDWVAAVRYLSEQGWYFNDHLRTSGVTAEGAIGTWQDEVRKTGLPAEYIEDLREAGWTEEQIAQHRDDLLASTPAELVRRHRQFTAACWLHTGDPTRGARPLEDGEWELASLRLLRLRAQLAEALPEE